MPFAASESSSASRSPAPSTPRMHWGPTLSRRVLLHGSWWPRSDDPFTELPGLILEVDAQTGSHATCLMLGLTGWESRPPRLRVSGRIVRLGWFTTQPSALITVSCADHHNVALLVVPPDTDEAIAEAAMELAAQPENAIPARDLLNAVIAQRAEQSPAAQGSAATRT